DPIVGPAGRATHEGVPIAFEPELVNRLLDDCTEGADTLPLLALTLSRLCADYTNGMQTSGVDSTLTLADYESMGGIRTVVRTEINDLLSTDPAQRSSELQSLRAAFIPWLATFNPDDDQ